MLLFWSQVSHGQDSFSDHDSNQPVEIESDNLVVRQAENLAIFTGNVDALQGTTTLKADKLIVYYQLSGEQSENSQPIEKIEAEGDVVITSPTETASGDEGIYDLV
ncbi:MAG: LptA/OstA family protein, partial [Pseudomonadota bacterium]